MPRGTKCKTMDMGASRRAGGGAHADDGTRMTVAVGYQGQMWYSMTPTIKQ